MLVPVPLRVAHVKCSCMRTRPSGRVSKTQLQRPPRMPPSRSRCEYWKESLSPIMWPTRHPRMIEPPWYAKHARTFLHHVKQGSGARRRRPRLSRQLGMTDRQDSWGLPPDSVARSDGEKFPAWSHRAVSLHFAKYSADLSYVLTGVGVFRIDVRYSAGGCSASIIVAIACSATGGDPSWTVDGNHAVSADAPAIAVRMHQCNVRSELEKSCRRSPTLAHA